MDVKLKIFDKELLSKTETKTTIEHIKYKDNLINKNDAKILLFHKNNSASGIIELSLKEFEAIQNKVQEEKALKKTRVDEVQKII